MRCRFSVFGQVDVDDVLGRGPDGDFVHVEDLDRHVHRAAAGHRDNGDGAREALREQRRAVDWVDGDVELGVGAVADDFAVVEHRRFVLLALADYDDAFHGDALQRVAHGVDRGLVDQLLVALAHMNRGSHRSRLGHSYQLHRQVAFHCLPDR